MIKTSGIPQNIEKINGIIANENVENIKYDLFLQAILVGGVKEYDYFKFLFDKDSSGELKNLMKSKRMKKF